MMNIIKHATLHIYQSGNLRNAPNNEMLRSNGGVLDASMHRTNDEMNLHAHHVHHQYNDQR